MAFTESINEGYSVSRDEERGGSDRGNGHSFSMLCWRISIGIPLYVFTCLTLEKILYCNTFFTNFLTS